MLAQAFGRAIHAFHPTMGLMGGFFLVLGGSCGFIASLYTRSLLEKRDLIAKQERVLNRDLNQLLSNGESEDVEFKSSLRWDRRLDKVNKQLEHAVLKTIAGFMNSNGGTLLIGVTDDGQPVGLEADWASLKRKDLDGFEQRLMELIATSLGTHYCPLVHVVFHKATEADVCRVFVESSPHPVYCQNKQNKHFYIRTGNSTHELNVEEVVSYTQLHWGNTI